MDETPKSIRSDADKPFISSKLQNSRVDINVLKARAKAIQDKENIKNTIAIIFLIIAVGTIGIYFSI